MKNFSILIIDDSEADRYLLKRNISKAFPEIKIYEAIDGDQALNFLSDYEKQRIELGEEFPPIITFLDINMPNVNGFEFLSSFQPIKSETPQYESCIFMMFTSSESEEDRKKALDYEFVKDFIVKGKFTSEELKEKIEKYL